MNVLPLWSTLPTQLKQRCVLTVSDWISVNNSCAGQPWSLKYRPQYNGIFRYSPLYANFVCNDGVFSLHWALMGPLNSPITVDRLVGRRLESHWSHRYSSVVFFVGWVGSGLCDGMSTCTYESYWLCVCLCVYVCVCVCVWMTVWYRNFNGEAA